MHDDCRSAATPCICNPLGEVHRAEVYHEASRGPDDASLHVRSPPNPTAEASGTPLRNAPRSIFERGLRPYAWLAAAAVREFVKRIRGRMTARRKKFT